MTSAQLVPPTLCLLLAPLALSACGSDDPSTPAAGTTTEGATGAEDGDADTTAAAEAETSFDYYADIKPLVDARCNNCHQDGGIAPFTLTTYEDLQTYGTAVLAAVQAHTMPPWSAVDGCTDYEADISLSDEQIDMLAAWIDEGMPEGNPDQVGAPWPEVDPGMSRVDQMLVMPEQYTPVQTPDDYRCFLIPWPEEYTTTQYVTGFGALPGNDAIVHHVIAFLAGPEDVETYLEMDAAEPGPGYTCFGGTGGPAQGWLGGWAPGGKGNDLPEGLGLPVEPGSMVILQVHYNALSTDVEPDETAIELRIDEQVEQPARIMPFANPEWLSVGMPIPAGEPDTVHTFSADLTNFLGGPVSIWSANLHMHLLGTQARMSINRASGSDDCLLQIDRWDFNWQGSYGLMQPKRLEPGDELRIECHYDNTLENQPYINGERQEPRDVSWGEGTTDEMCLGTMLVTVDQ